MITIDKTHMLDGQPSIVLIQSVRKAYEATRTHIGELKDIYDRKHDIANRTRLRGLPNNKLANDLPGYIVTMSAGYLVGSPAEYTPARGEEEAFRPIREALKAAISDNVDAELAVDAAVCGKAVEICYANEQSEPRIAQVSPSRAFVVYDDTVERRPLFGITVSDILGEDLQSRGELVTVYTDREITRYTAKGIGESAGALTYASSEPHYFGAVPLVEYWNNSREQGDFEPVIDLINAYDALQSDRVNDKQQFTDSILALYGVGGLGTEEDGEAGEDGGSTGSGLTPSQRLRQTKTLFMPGDGAHAEWLTKPASESDSEILRRSIKEDIHKFCMVPDLTEENFAGNASGVAMRYKLLGLEQLTKIKERWFREGLRQRLRLFSAFLSIRGAAPMDVDSVQITFKRSLPVNEMEIAQMVTAYDGMVPRKLLLGQVPFIDDPAEAIRLLEEERADGRRTEAIGAMPLRSESESSAEDALPEREAQ